VQAGARALARRDHHRPASAGTKGGPQSEYIPGGSHSGRLSVRRLHFFRYLRHKARQYRSTCFLSFCRRPHCLNNCPSGVDRCLRGINCRHDVGSGRGIQTKRTTDPRHLTGRKHESQAEERMVFQDHKPGSEDRC
ncbi:ComE operon protein 1, partial [Dysosmobacter welbionis]